jgi:hypothetical protein
MKTFLKTEKEKKAFIIAAVVVVLFFAISLLFTGKAHASTITKISNGDNARVSQVLVDFGKPSFTTHKPFKMYYCYHYSNGRFCIVFSFKHSPVTEKMLKKNVRSHYIVYKEKLVTR